MNKNFSDRLEKFLISECSDYDLNYSWEWNDDEQCCNVEVKRDDHTQNIKCLSFKYDSDHDDLLIELSEDSYYITREFDQTVKYFWMLIAPAIFPE